MPYNQQYIAIVAPKHKLPVALVAAIVQVESSGDRFAHRVEPAYRWLWDVVHHAPYHTDSVTASRRLPPSDFPSPDGISPNTEWLDQQSSWGLMQVMGAVAREQGFTGPMPGLTDPLLGLNHGCRLLAKRRDQNLGAFGWAGVVASYNAGSVVMRPDGSFANQAYVDAVAKAGGAEVTVLLNGAGQ